MEQTPYYQYQEKIKAERIPYYEPSLGGEELEQLTEVIKANWISEGAKTREFETRLAQFCGVKHALAVSNCTGGLIISLMALGIKPGDEVIVPTFTFIASANSIRLAGATAVLVDVDEKTLCINPDAVEAAITPRTKAIMPVHIYGQAADIERIIAIAKKHGLHVVEDTAQGLGVKFNGKPVGSFGEIGCLSFFTDKTITIGEGGMVLTNSPELARELLMLKHDGRVERGIFVHERVAYNFRITEIQAAVGVAQLNKLETHIQRKRHNEQLYRQYLAGVEGIAFPYWDARCFVVPHRHNILVDDPEGLLQYLAKQGIGSRRFYMPVHMQPCYNISGHFPNAESAYRRGLSLPTGPLLKKEQIAYVCEKIIDYMRNKPV